VIVPVQLNDAEAASEDGDCDHQSPNRDPDRSHDPRS
jgi:hypothetical protein